MVGRGCGCVLRSAAHARNQVFVSPAAERFRIESTHRERFRKTAVAVHCDNAAARLSDVANERLFRKISVSAYIRRLALSWVDPCLLGTYLFCAVFWAGIFLSRIFAA